MSRFPAAFRLPAFASRSSHSRQGIGSPHGRPTDPHRAGPRRGYRVPHARATTGVGAPYTPRTSGAHPAGSPPRPAPAASQRPVPKPRHDIPPRELSFTRHQQGFNHVHPSGLPLARAPGMEPQTLRLSPELRTPPTPAAHDRGGDRPTSTDLEQRSRHQPNLRSCVFTQCVRPRVARRFARLPPSATARPAFVIARDLSRHQPRHCCCPQKRGSQPNGSLVPMVRTALPRTVRSGSASIVSLVLVQSCTSPSSGCRCPVVTSRTRVARSSASVCVCCPCS